MSRSARDRPRWVRANDPRLWVGEDHAHTEFGVECTIDEPATPRWHQGICNHVLRGDEVPERRYNRVSRRRRHNDYWAPERAARRTRLGNAVAEYRATGGVDEDQELTERQLRGSYVGHVWH
jgi:hypothetical protein